MAKRVVSTLVNFFCHACKIIRPHRREEDKWLCTKCNGELKL